MNKLTQHIPNFAYSGQPYEEWEFNTVEELLALEWVKGFKKEGKTFCIQDNKLMIVADDNRWFWHVGDVKYPVDLPKWSSSTGIIRDVK